MKHPLLFALLATIIALALRLPHLERRPMHTDEAVHGVRFADLLERGAYEYDPHDYHGPMLYYATLPVAWLRGERTLWQLTETTLRLVPLLFGIGLILLLYLAGGALGRAEAAWAALFTAVSPFMVYFSRYYIMEMLLVFFTFALLLSVWRYWQSGKAGWAVAVGVCVGLMHATKETCVITWFCVAVALAGLWFVQSQRPAVRPAHLVAFVLAAVVVSVTLFSVFYTDWRGVPQSVLTYFHYIRRGQGSGHEHPWYAYLRWFVWHRTGKIVWTELAILLLAMLGGVLAFRQQHGFGKLLGFYAAVMAAVYFLIPYKTPWSILSWVHALILLAGIAAAWLAKRVPWLAWPLLLVVAAHLAFQSLRAISARFECDERAPYVYSHTSRDAVRLAERIQQIAAVSPERKRMVVKFMAKEYWPLPWYLREMPHVGYWNQPADPTGASVIITSPEFNLDFGEGWQTELFGLRPGVVLVVHIRRDLWDKFMESRR
ncbi:MAG: TIGR03663 family protein [Verrucomicrobiae bacterium]|nr:TIGR03663 family protein [Verrucomicrobiae bacterium]